MGIIATIIGVIVGCFGFALIHHYATYNYHPWEKKYMKIVHYHWGDAIKYSFEEQYKNHSHETSSPVTRSMSFENFLSIYNINPDKWNFKEYNGRDVDFTLKYKIKKPEVSWYYDRADNYIQVIFNKKDFNKYRRWLAVRAKQREEHQTTEALKQDYDAMQKIISTARQDIDVMENRAKEETHIATAIATAAANNEPCPEATIHFDPKTCSYYIKKNGEFVQIGTIDIDGSLKFSPQQELYNKIKIYQDQMSMNNATINQISSYLDTDSTRVE